ncbi:MAG: hypothetical protein AB7Q16_18900 [Vicinamibacterales bacterium]
MTDWTLLLDVRLLCWVGLPVLTGLATLADPNPRRARLWFWGGVGATLASLLLLAER